VFIPIGTDKGRDVVHARKHAIIGWTGGVGDSASTSMISMENAVAERAGVGCGPACNAGGMSGLSPKKFVMGVGFLQVDAASFFKWVLLAL
jgi:hypothetical protein